MSKLSGDGLEWLMSWYRAACDGDWEHQYGVRIGTLDNPGWFLEVDLTETPAEHRTLQRSLIERAEDDWYVCETKDGKFVGHGGPGNLKEIIAVFRAFVSEDPS